MGVLFVSGRMLVFELPRDSRSRRDGFSLAIGVLDEACVFADACVVLTRWCGKDTKKKKKRESESSYEVSKLVERRLNTREGPPKLEWLVQWKNYPVSESTIEPHANLDNCREQVTRFFRANPKAVGHSLSGFNA